MTTIRRAVTAACIFLFLTGSVVQAEAEEVEQYGSLDVMTLAADAVVLGQVLSVEPGRVLSGCGYAAATVKVEALLAGTLRGGALDQLTLEYFGFCGALPSLGEDIPRERAVFFLRNKGTEMRLVQPEATEQDLDAESNYWRTVIRAGTVVDRNGVVHVPETSNAPFLELVEGNSFLDFVADVRAFGGGPPAASTAPDQATTPDPIGALAIVGLGVSGVLVARRKLVENQKRNAA